MYVYVYEYVYMYVYVYIYVDVCAHTHSLEKRIWRRSEFGEENLEKICRESGEDLKSPAHLGL